MALKMRIAKSAYDKLSDDLKGEYVLDGDEYKLDVSGVEDTDALKRAKDHEKTARKEAEKKLRELQEKLEDDDDAASRAKGDIDALTKSYEKKIADKDTTHNETLSKKDAFIQKTLIDAEAQRIASEVSTSPKLLMPHIKSRLTVDLDGDDPTVRILDSDGKVSAMKPADLGKEFVDNADFKAIIKSTEASGSGGPGTKPGGTGGADKSSKPDTPLHEMDNDALIAHVQAKQEAAKQE